MNTSRLDMSDPALLAAVKSVRSDDDPATYLVFGYEGKAKIVCKKVGDGSCYQALEEFDDSEVSFALLRVTGTRDQERAKPPTRLLASSPHAMLLASRHAPCLLAPRHRRAKL